MLMPKTPMRQYASSSSRVVLRVLAHDIRRATLTSARSCSNRSTAVGTRVTLSSKPANSALYPRIVQSAETKMSSFGATSSCSVQPRACQRLLRNAESFASSASPRGTSRRKA